MSMIQIRNVSGELHRRAKSRAAMEGMTLSDLALRALEREVARPTVAELAARIRTLPSIVDAPPMAELVRELRDSR
ncbi:MAG: hypothetical protein WEA09_11615 [Gemmatimonadota bacterium]